MLCGEVLMRGSVVKKSDRWYVVIEDGDPSTGARKRRWHSGFRTKREAQAACNELVVAMQRGDYLQANRQTVGEFACSGWRRSRRRCGRRRWTSISVICARM